MMADKTPYLEPEEVLNDGTFSTDAERDRYFRSGLSRREKVLSLAAAKATIAALRDWEVIPHLWQQGRRLRDGYNALGAEVGLAGRTECIGLHPRTVVTFKHADGPSCS